MFCPCWPILGSYWDGLVGALGGLGIDPGLYVVGGGALGIGPDLYEVGGVGALGASIGGTGAVVLGGFGIGPEDWYVLGVGEEVCYH